jgi:muconolactone delta-isomerase
MSGLLRKAWRSDQKAKLDILSARDTDKLSDALRSLPIWPLIALEVNPLWRLIHSLPRPMLHPDHALQNDACGTPQGWHRQVS